MTGMPNYVCIVLEADGETTTLSGAGDTPDAAAANLGRDLESGARKSLPRARVFRNLSAEPVDDAALARLLLLDPVLHNVYQLGRVQGIAEADARRGDQ